MEVLEGLDLNEIDMEYILIEIQKENYKDLIENYLGKNYMMIEKISHHDYLFKKMN